MMRALNAQLLKSFLILKECLSMRLSNPTYFFPYVGKSRSWEILFKENLLHAIPSPVAMSQSHKLITLA